MGELGGFLRITRSSTPQRDPHERVADYEEIYRTLGEDQAASEGARCMECGVPFCHDGCPLGNLIPDWNDLVYQHRWRDAIDQLHATNDFPEFTGRICPAPCEPACVLAINDDPVAIKNIELAIVERAWEEGWIVPSPPAHRTGRRVAVVGSGPAGLAAANQLNRAGHSVTVYERDEGPGGLLRFGVPDPKLEKWVIDRRVAVLAAEGVAFEYGADVGGHCPRTSSWRRMTRSSWRSARACTARYPCPASTWRASGSRWTTSTRATAGSPAGRIRATTPSSRPPASTW